MKIAFVSNFTPATNYTRDLSLYFYKLLRRNDRLYLCGKRSEVIQDSKEPFVHSIWERNWKFFPQILGYILRKNPEVVHFQQEIKMYGGLITALIFPWLLLITKILGKKVVVTIHGVVSPKQINKDFLETFNMSYNLPKKLCIKMFFAYIYKLIGAFSDAITVHAPMLKNILVEEYGISEKKVYVIDHGIREIKDLRKIIRSPQIYKRFPSLKDKNIVLVFGYFSPRKGYEFLIDAFKHASIQIKKNDWVLSLVGDVTDEFLPYKKKVEKLIKSKSLEKNILISGYVDDGEIDEFYRLAKIVLIPAIVSFNTSGSLSLALAYQKPLLVSNLKPLALEVSDNDFGLLYDNSSVESCTDQLVELMSNEKLYNDLSKKLSTSVQKRYWTKIAKKHYDLYKSIK